VQATDGVCAGRAGWLRGERGHRGAGEGVQHAADFEVLAEDAGQV